MKLCIIDYKRLKEDIIKYRYFIISLIIYFIVMQLLFGNVCIFRIITKIPCPGCGLTRAGLSLLRLDFKSAIKYNITIFLWLPFIIFLLIDRYIKKINISKNLLVIIVSLATILNYIIKLILGVKIL